MVKREDYRIASLEKGLTVLQLFGQEPAPLRLRDIAERTSLPVPTAFRYVRTLELGGFLEQTPEGAYRPGHAVLTLGFAALQTLDLVQVARGALQRLAETTGETVNLGILVGAEVLYLERIKNADLVTAALQVGSTLPAVCTSMGKLLLAHHDDQSIAERWEATDVARCRGPNAHASLEQLQRECAQIRARGWSMQDQQVAHGLRSIAAPIMRGPDAVVAAVNIAVQASRWTTDDMVSSLLPDLLETSRVISRSLSVAPQYQE